MELEGGIQTYHLFNANSESFEQDNYCNTDALIGNVGVHLPSMLEPILSVGNEEENNNTVNLN